MVIFIYVQFYTWQQFILSLPFLMIWLIAFYTFMFDTVIALTLSFFVIYYEHLRVDKINKSIQKAYDDRDNRHVHRLVKQFTDEQNRYCIHIWTLDKFIKRSYLAICVLCIPINLLLMHQIFFETVPIHMKIFNLSMLVLNDSAVFLLQFINASLSKKIHSMSIRLSCLQWSVNGYPFRMRIKFKLLMCFERLSAKKKIGLTFAGTTMTYPRFGQVILSIIKCLSN